VGGFRLAIDRLASWWAQASSEDRFRLVKAAIDGAPEAPPLEVCHLAAFLAETEQGTVDQG
jgi:hypothetical protein